jgi:hypothetical protein
MSVGMLAKKNAAVPAVKAPAKGASNGLRIGASNDYFEQEAERVAEEVMAGGTAKRDWSISRMTINPPLQRSCGCGGSGGSTGECEECKEKKTLQRKSSATDGPAVAPPIVHEVLNSPGQPLDRATLDFFEPRFGHDLSRVRIHSDAQAAESARAVNASAYTVGSHVVFGRTSSPLERTLLAHELTHVAQQTWPIRSSPTSDESSLEKEANQAASAISHSARQISVRNASVPRISRQESTLPQALAFLTPQDIAKLKGFGAADYQASLDTLEKMFRVTGDLTEKGLPRQFVSTRQASGELRTFLDVIRNPKVQAVKVVPSASGGRSPDLYYGEISGAESRVEVVNITAAAARTRAELQQTAGGAATSTIPKEAGNVINTVEEINTAGKLREAIRVKVKAGSQLSSQNPNTRVAGRPMETGGEVRVSTSHVELSKDEIDAVIKDLQPELANSPATKIVVDTIDKADPRGGRKLFEYAKDEKRNFVYSETRVSYARQAVSDVSGDAASTAAKLTTEAEGDVAEHALADAAASRLPKITAQTAEKDLAETAAEAFTRSATSTATRRMGQATAPVIGAVFAAPDAWEGVKDIAHGDLFTGIGTIGVAIIDVASQGLHATDEVSGGGGTVLAITIQTWAAAMQFGFESERIRQRSSELKAYMKAHGNHLPPRDELMSYYRLNDEDILILENDIYKAQQNKVTTEDMAKQVRALLAQIDANANKALPQGVTPAGIQEERARLSKLLVALEAKIQQEKAQAAKERAAADEKRRQQNFDRAQQQQKQAAAVQATPQLLPSPGVSQQQQQQTAAPDPFGLFSPATPQPLSGISMENAELAGTGFGRMRNALLARYPQLESEHFPQDKVNKYQSDVTAYVNNLDRMIAEFMKKGSAEWPGVKEMRRLRDAADNTDRSKLMR